MKLIGARLQYYRLKRGIKQEYVASSLHVSKSCISKVENGRTTIQLHLFLKYCAVLETAAHEILDGVPLE